LNLAANKLSDEALRDLWEALMVGNPPLLELNLSNNKMGESAW
jgi:hypothetical protein